MMDTTARLHEDPVFAWQDRYSIAAYASEAVVHLINPDGFSSASVKWLFQNRGGFMRRLYRSNEGETSTDRRFLGAILNKIVFRGNPTPCSLKVENYVLQKAQENGLLTFKRFVDCGKIKFTATAIQKDLDLMLGICFLPELLVDDSVVGVLLANYEALLEDENPAKWFFHKLMKSLPDRRLALFVVPGSLLRQDCAKGISDFEDEADFVIQIPNLRKKTISKIAIQLGEDLNHFEDHGGWTLKRFGEIKRQYWESEIRKLADQIACALTQEVMTLSKQLREMPIEKKIAIQELIFLPIAEAQLTETMAHLIYNGETAKIAIRNPHDLDLSVVLDAVQETIDELASLYGIQNEFHLSLVDGHLDADLEYHPLPVALASSCASIVPWPIRLCRTPVRYDAIPRSIRQGCSSSTKRNLRFILNNIFRYQDFLADQAELIERMLSLKGSIGLLKPRGGNTQAYQLASLLQPGTSLVVVPTRYEAISQINRLDAIGIQQTDFVSKSDVDCRQCPLGPSIYQESDIFFLTADTSQDDNFAARLKGIFLRSLNFLIFDEAHTLSEWSHSFLPGYLNLVRRTRSLSRMDSDPAMIALTSINSRLVLLDIMTELGLDDLDCIVESTKLDCKNIRYRVLEVDDENRMQVLISALKATLREYGWRGRNEKIPSGIIISAQKGEEDLSLAVLSKSLGPYLNIPIGVISLEPTKKYLRLGGTREGWHRIGQKALLEFERNELPILVCSPEVVNGLYNEDIRFILYAGLPASLDELYRISCLGANSMDSSSIILFSAGQENFGREDLSNGCGDYFKDRGQLDYDFPGRVMEKRIQTQVILRLLSSAHSQNFGDKVDSEIFVKSFPDRLFRMSDGSKQSFERKQKLLEMALYRLLLIGAIESYEIRAESFSVSTKFSEASQIYKNYNEYISKYELETLPNYLFSEDDNSTYLNAVLKCGCSLIEYSYFRIKARREDDLAKMFLAAKEDLVSPGTINYHLHDSLESVKIAPRLIAMESERWWTSLDGIKGSEGLLGLLLSCHRKLKQNPNDPVLRVMTGFCSLAFPFSGYSKRASEDLSKGFFSFAGSSQAEDRADAARGLISHAERLMPSGKDLILESIWRADPSLEMSRFCYEKSDLSCDVCYLSLFKLANGLLVALNAEGV